MMLERDPSPREGLAILARIVARKVLREDSEPEQHDRERGLCQVGPEDFVLAVRSPGVSQEREVPA